MMLHTRILLDLPEIARVAGVVEQEPLELAALIINQCGIEPMTAQEFHEEWRELVKSSSSPVLQGVKVIAELDQTSPTYLQDLNDIMIMMPSHMNGMAFLKQTVQIMKAVKQLSDSGKWKGYK